MRAAASQHRARRDRFAADLEASMRAFGKAAFDNPDQLDDALADAEDALERAAP